jgi:hypothetical protein
MENLVRNIILAATITLIGTKTAIAQYENTLPLIRTCLVAAPTEKGQPRLILFDSRNGEKVTNYIQINSPTKLSGRLEAITISVDPFDTRITVKGLAPQTGGNFVRAVVTDGWGPLLNRIREGYHLNLAAGDETITISLKGSGVAVAALERCTK